MAVLTAGERKDMPKKNFAGPGKSFPDEDAVHAREAISGAVRAWHAGHITDEEAQHIIHEARDKLAKFDGNAND